ncbi:MAG: ABC transporter permease [Bacillota bacterium]|nr:ABC transporter permease [Bacillota bacterium]
MSTYVARRLLWVPVTVWGVITITFFLMYIIPGDPARILIGGHVATAEGLAQLRHQMGLDRPVLVQYVDYLTKALRGDLGRSFRLRVPISTLILQRVPNTALLAAASVLIALLVAVPLGVLAATSRSRAFDRLVIALSTAGVSAPAFWVGVVSLYYLAFRARWLPIGGTGTVAHLVLPVLVLGLRPTAVLARLTRSSMLDVVRADYVRTARAKGLGERTVIYRHALRNAINPVLTYSGLLLAYLLGGAVVIENVFAWPGLGKLLVDAMGSYDFPLVQGVVLFSASVIVLFNLLVDVLYAVLDPRVSYR